jgi:serpin B
MTRRRIISHLPLLGISRSVLGEPQARPGTQPSLCAEGASYDAERWKACLATTKAGVESQNTFGLNLLRQMAEHSAGKNVFLSPLGVSIVLQMVENGAAGTTRMAIQKVLASPAGEAPARNTSSAALRTLLSHQRGIELSIASALWADPHWPLAPAFVKLCASVFDARAGSLNFSDPAASARINNWFRAKTRGKIANVVVPRRVAKQAVILANAVYFAGRWHDPFPVADTRDDVFRKTDGSKKVVRMMHQSGLKESYRRGENFECAMLRYKDSSIFFYALLPRLGLGPKDVLESLDGRHPAGKPEAAELELKLPRVTLDLTANLKNDLEALGMGIAFRPGEADFGPMGSRKFFLDDVTHKTHLTVDEEGTVAAAATAVGIAGGIVIGYQPPPRRTLIFDRPFVILIGDSLTDTILFAGVIEEP